MENTIESQKAEREELSLLRMARQLEATASKPVKQQWGAFKEQLRKVREYAMGIIQSHKEWVPKPRAADQYLSLAY